MDRSRVITLISENYVKDDIAQLVPQEKRRDVFCNVTSISASEWFEAGRNGLRPQYRAILFAPDYQGEITVELDGVRYGVYRTYIGKNEMIELYLERKACLHGKADSSN